MLPEITRQPGFLWFVVKDSCVERLFVCTSALSFVPPSRSRKTLALWLPSNTPNPKADSHHSPFAPPEADSPPFDDARNSKADSPPFPAKEEDDNITHNSKADSPLFPLRSPGS